MLCAAASGALGQPPSLAVISHPELPIDDISLTDLKRVFLGDRQFWPGGVPVTLLVPAPRSPERALLLQRVYDKTETQYQHYWIAKVFRAEVASAPKSIPSAAVAAELVRSIEGAIAVVDAAAVPRGVRVIRVDGKGSADSGYPLR
jgi:hypothetical protein